MPRKAKTARRETVTEQNERHLVSESFEERTTATLHAQDRVLERMQQKLEDSPVLNGGFEDLTKKVDKIENVQAEFRKCQTTTGQKITEIHDTIFEPDKGLYVTVRGHAGWIDTATKAGKWLLALLIAGTLTGVGKLLYDVVSGHIHFSP
jgi:hypothetical protein